MDVIYVEDPRTAPFNTYGHRCDMLQIGPHGAQVNVPAGPGCHGKSGRIAIVGYLHAINLHVELSKGVVLITIEVNRQRGNTGSSPILANSKGAFGFRINCTAGVAVEQRHGLLAAVDNRRLGIRRLRRVMTHERPVCRDFKTVTP